MTADGNFEKGKEEIIGATKLLNECFSSHNQIRLVGNHDPNSQGTQDYFTAYQLYAFTGIYTNIKTSVRNEISGTGRKVNYLGNVYYDFEQQKTRIITLNTSEYWQTEEPIHNGTEYRVGWGQCDWLCRSMDLTDKGDDAINWNIIIFAHVAADALETANKIASYLTPVFSAYESGTLWYHNNAHNYDFTNKNVAKLSMYVCGHAHFYGFRNCREVTYSNNSAQIIKNLCMPILYVPNALPFRNEPSNIDPAMIYNKTPDTQNSTAFQVITIDKELNTVYAHHYGAGIDVIMHYMPTSNSTFSTNLSTPSWGSVNTDIATVSNGIVTPVSDGYTMIYAKSISDNTIECWNYSSAI